MPTVDLGGSGGLPSEVASFVGRRREVSELKELLADSRLVTLTGVGGVGKTRLALRVASRVRRAFRDGVWFVDLTQLENGDLLAQEIQTPDTLAYLVMTTLKISQHDRPPLQQLTGFLADRRMLLVLDNCEHLLPACAVLIETPLRACPGLRVLATSREPLAIRGEVVYSVAPLPVPEEGFPAKAADLARCESPALFLERARATAPGFVLTPARAAAVAELCRRLEGLPLAIELAAAWIRTLEPQQILDRLADRFGMLSRGSRDAPARQQALRTCVEWSFTLCDKSERLLWSRLSVFVGGFELDAVEGVCTDDCLPAGDLLDVLTSLIEKSIVDRVDATAGQARYRMLETLREYGQQQLAEAGDLEVLRGRHRDWYQRLAMRASTERVTSRQTYWIARLNREHPNVRAAVEYSLSKPGEADEALQILTSLPWLSWRSSGVCREGLGWIERALARTTAPTALRVRSLLLAAHLAAWLGDTAHMTARVDDGYRLARRLHDGPGLALAASVRATVAVFGDHDLPGARESARRGLTILSALPEREQHRELALRVSLLLQLGQLATSLGDHDGAGRCYHEALEITESRGAVLNQAWAMWGLAQVAGRHGDTSAAVDQARKCLRLARQEDLPDPYFAALCIEGLAWFVARQRRYRYAATLLGAADRCQTDFGKPPATNHTLTVAHDQCERDVRGALGDPAFTEAFRRGRAAPLADALAYALDERRKTVPPPSPPPPPGESSTPLTRRERQVAELVAQGLTNKEIAGRLVISQRTAEGHVERVLAKLGFTNRTRVATWIAERPPPATPP